MERMGETVVSLQPFDILTDNQPLLIKEGLIMSYPTEHVMQAIADNNNLTIAGKSNTEIMSNLRGTGDVKNGDIKIVRPNGNDENLLVTLKGKDETFNKINSHMLKYGWVNYRTDENEGEYKFYFEKKFGDRFTVKKLAKVTDKIYHVSSARVAQKILNQGLIPKPSKTPGFENEPRIYFRVDIPSRELADDLVRMKGDLSPAKVFEVDLAKINQNQSFFFDSRWVNSVFTFEPIPPDAIRLMEKDELPKIKLNY